MRSWVAPLLLVIAIAAASAAAYLASTAIPIASVGGEVGGRLEYVLPGGTAWEAGARPGQTIITFGQGARPEQWRMVLMDADRRINVDKGDITEYLRGTFPLAAFAVAVALIAIFTAPVSPRTAAFGAVLAVAAARQPLVASGDLAASSAGAVAAVAVPAVWLLAWSPWRRAAALVAVLFVGLATLWLGLRFVAAGDVTLAGAFDLTAALMLVGAYALTATVMVAVLGAMIRARGGYDGRRTGDVVVLGALAASIPLALAANAGLMVIVLGVVVVLVVYPLVRRSLGRTLDQFVLGDLRARSSIEAIERERRRVARDIHDEPLQDLAAVIGRLARHPGLEAETRMLQEVSGHLRGVTMQLHPPILADLGLALALEFLVEDAQRDASARVRLEQETPVAGSRPPADVELAAYRITQEALTNAIRHSAARTVLVRASVDAAAVLVSVTDDGVGLDRVATREALTRGHVGLRSMAERAQLVGGELDIEDAGPGTRVTFRWPA